jgi:hypothetical protein
VVNNSIARRRAMKRAPVFVASLPVGLTMLLVTTAPHLHADVLVFLVISYMGISTLSLHGLLRLQDHPTSKRHGEDQSEVRHLVRPRSHAIRSLISGSASAASLAEESVIQGGKAKVLAFRRGQRSPPLRPPK